MDDDGMMNPKEFREIENLNKNLKSMVRSIDKLTDTISKINSPSNHNTLMFKLVDAVKEAGKKIKPSD